MRYAIYFAISVVCLTVGAVLTFNRISAIGLAVVRADTLAPPTADTLPSREVVTPVNPTPADYAKFAEADAAWRARNAHQYTVAELRALGNGKRTERESMQDRVFELVQGDQLDRAIGELERWVSAHPSDREQLLSLARLLSETGRSDEAIRRYRQILALDRPQR